MKARHTAACEALCKCDRRLAKLIQRIPCQLRADRTQSVFDALMESIVYQQLTGKAAATILERTKALFNGGPAASANGRRAKGAPFPTPQQVADAPEELLRTAGLSRAKALALKDLAAKTLDGTVPEVARIRRMKDEDVIERITQVRGIGRWTVEMLLIFRLGRPDVWPVDDYGVRKGYAKLHKLTELPKPKELLELGEKYRPHRSVASWYFWRAAETLPPLQGKK